MVAKTPLCYMIVRLKLRGEVPRVLSLLARLVESFDTPKMHVVQFYTMKLVRSDVYWPAYLLIFQDPTLFASET